MKTKKIDVPIVIIKVDVTISVVLLSFMVQDPSGIMECTRDMSLFSSFFIYLTISVSEWWILKTGCVMKGDVLAKGESKRLPSILAGESMDSAIWARLFGQAKTHSRSFRSSRVVVSSIEIPTACSPPV